MTKEIKVNSWMTVINNNFNEKEINSKSCKCNICNSFYNKTNNRQINCISHILKLTCQTCGKEVIVDNKHFQEYYKRYLNEMYFCPKRSRIFSCKDRYNKEIHKVFENKSIKVYGYSFEDKVYAECTCQRCGKNIKINNIDSRRINPIINGKDYFCIDCVRIKNGYMTSSQNITKYNKSKKHRETAAENLSNYLKSDEGQNWLCNIHNKSEKMKKQAIDAGKKYGKFNLKNIISYGRDDNGRIVYIQKLNQDRIPFKDYCSKFIVNSPLNVNFKDLGFVDVPFDCSEKHPSYPTLACEQYISDLFEDNPWLVYIKYYIDFEGASRPIVVGKTGTIKVNSSGTDICFDIKKNDKRAARQFLADNNLSWDKSKISAIGFKTEQEALNFEDYIINKFSFLGG